MNKNILAVWFLRAGLSFVFTYASYEIFVNPQNFLKYTPSFVFTFIPVRLFLYSFAIIELLLAAWLLTGWKPVYPAVTALLLIAGIIIFNTEYFNVLFRNVAIGTGALSLIMLETEQKIKQSIIKRFATNVKQKMRSTYKRIIKYSNSRS